MIFGSGILGLFLTIVVILLVYFLIKLLIDRAPGISDNIKSILGYVWLVLCVLWVVSIILAIAGYPISGMLGTVRR